MSFTTKKYTRPFLLKELSKLNSKSFSSVSNFVNSFSPRAGRSSAKMTALKSAVGKRNFGSLFNNASSGKYVKKELMNLIKLRS